MSTVELAAGPRRVTSRWQHRLGTIGVVALCWAAGMLLLGQTLSEKYPDLDAMTSRQNTFVGLDLVIGTIACLLLPVVRCRRPRRAALAALVIAATTVLSSFGFAAVCYVLVAVGDWRERRWLVAVDVAVVAGTLGYLVVVPGEHLTGGEILLLLGLVAALNLWGMYRGSRRALAASLRERADGLEREHRARLAQARAEERTAIAREMHDTLSHRLAVISLHAGGLSVRPDLAPGQVTQTATLIQQTAQDASEELRSLLTVLRSDDGDRGEPLTVASLDEVLQAARGQGDVTLQLDDQVREQLSRLSPQASAALAHALREGLANAAKHAPGLGAHVALTADGEGMRLGITNPLSASPSVLAGGYGLVGLAERLAMAGGWLRHGVERQEHRLEAWVPWN